MRRETAAISWNELPQFCRTDWVILIVGGKSYRASECYLNKAQHLIDLFGRAKSFCRSATSLRARGRANQPCVALAETGSFRLVATHGVDIRATGSDSGCLYLPSLEHGSRCSWKIAYKKRRPPSKVGNEMLVSFATIRRRFNTQLFLAERFEFSLENIGMSSRRFPVPGGMRWIFLRKITLFGAPRRFPLSGKDLNDRSNKSSVSSEKLDLPVIF